MLRMETPHLLDDRCGAAVSEPVNGLHHLLDEIINVVLENRGADVQLIAPDPRLQKSAQFPYRACLDLAP